MAKMVYRKQARGTLFFARSRANDAQLAQRFSEPPVTILYTIVLFYVDWASLDRSDTCVRECGRATDSKQRGKAGDFEKRAGLRDPVLKIEPDEKHHEPTKTELPKFYSRSLWYRSKRCREALHANAVVRLEYSEYLRTSAPGHRRQDLSGHFREKFDRGVGPVVHIEIVVLAFGLKLGELHLDLQRRGRSNDVPARSPVVLVIYGPSGQIGSSVSDSCNGNTEMVSEAPTAGRTMLILVVQRSGGTVGVVRAREGELLGGGETGAGVASTVTRPLYPNTGPAFRWLEMNRTSIPSH